MTLDKPFWAAIDESGQVVYGYEGALTGKTRRIVKSEIAFQTQSALHTESANRRTMAEIKIKKVVLRLADLGYEITSRKMMKATKAKKAAR